MDDSTSRFLKTIRPDVDHKTFSIAMKILCLQDRFPSILVQPAVHPGLLVTGVVAYPLPKNETFPDFCVTGSLSRIMG
jgi:hypothetical protein